MDSNYNHNFKNKSQVFCTKCGSENKIDSNFCHNCGESLDESKLENRSNDNSDESKNESYKNRQEEDVVLTDCMYCDNEIGIKKIIAEKGEYTCPICYEINYLDKEDLYRHHCLTCNNKVKFENELCDNCKLKQNSSESEIEKIDVHKKTGNSTISWLILLIGVFMLLYSFSIRPKEIPIDINVPYGTLGGGIMEKTYNIQSDYAYNMKRIESEKKSIESNTILLIGVGLSLFSILLFFIQSTQHKKPF